jgi:hypothetical protein
MADKLKSRTHAVQQPSQQRSQPQQQQQQQPPRRRRQSLSAGTFWKLGVPIVLLFCVFTILNRVGRDIEDVHGIRAVSKTQTQDADANDITTTTTTTTGSKEGRIAERRKKRDQKRSDLVHDKRRKQKESSSTTVLFDYNQPAVRSNTNDTTTLNEPTADYSTAKTIVFVMSARENFERRAVIRHTWGKDHAVYFVTGGQPASERQKKTANNYMSIQDRLVQEQATHQDLIDSIHPESYRGLPHKLKFSYQWILKNWPNVQWLVKVDDDTVVRMDTLQAVVLDMLNPAQPIIAGRIMVDAPVHKTGKWAELLYTESETYPYWPQGSCGHAVSRPVAEYVSQKAASGELTLYQGEDTSLGIWMHEASVKKELEVTWFKSQYFTNNGYCHSRQWLIIGHRISPAKMKACYIKSDEWTEEYRLSGSKNLWHMNTEEQNEAAFLARMAPRLSSFLMELLTWRCYPWTSSLPPWAVSRLCQANK